LEPGEYYVNKVIKMGGGTIVLPNGWYPYVFVKYAVEQGYIALSDIQYVIKAGETLKADYFCEWAQNLVNKFPNESKLLINCFIGELNKQSIKSEKGCLTDSYDIAMGMLFNYPDLKIYKIGELFFLRQKKTEPLLRGNVPIWRHVIASSYIKLDCMYQRLVNEHSTVISYCTDSIKIQGETNEYDLKPKEETPIGGIHKEERIGLVYGNWYNDPERLKREEYKMEVRVVRKIDEREGNSEEIEVFVRENSCLVIGMAGCGKTHLITQSYGDTTDIVFCFTNKACDVLRKYWNIF